MTTTSHDVCRLCGERSTYVFNHQVLERHDVAYFECDGCGSLQTERPTWLEEAYAIPGTHIDVGQANRIVRMWMVVSQYLINIGYDTSAVGIDYGGSVGLLARLMRDSGYNFFSYDAFESSKYADYFQIDDLDQARPSLITAFEVVEHMVDPAQELGAMLARAPDLVIFSTQFWEEQGPEWDYLVPCCGQHVFFYTAKGLADFAEARGYALHKTSLFNVLVRSAGQYPDAGDERFHPAFSEESIGRLLMSCWGGKQRTADDGVYARERFIRELRAADPQG